MLNNQYYKRKLAKKRKMSRNNDNMETISYQTSATEEYNIYGNNS